MKNIQQIYAGAKRFYNNWYGALKIEGLKMDPAVFESHQKSVFLKEGTEKGHLIRKALSLIDMNQLKGKRVLDYACGDGEIAVYFALKGANVYGFDISEMAIKRSNLRTKVNRVENRTKFDVMSAERLNYESESFDLIFGTWSLHHTHIFKKSHNELYRVLKRGGKAIFTEPLGENPFIEICRKIIIWREKNRQHAGETTLKYRDIFRVGKLFLKINLYETGFLFMIKRFFRGKFHLPFVKPLLKIAFICDKILLKLFPFLKRYCGEIVIEFIK